MKVHHITEAPRIEPNIGSSSGSASLPKSVDIKPGILDSKGNKTFNVVDQDGKVLKRFSGASAEADANIHSDKLKKQIKAEKPKPKKPKPKLTGDPKKDLKATPKPKNDANKASKGFFRKWVGGIVKFFSIGILGNAIQVALNVPQLEDAFDAYLRSLAKAGMTDPTKCRTIGQISKDNKSVPQEVVDSYTKVVELTAELIIEGIVGAFSALSTPIAYTLAAALFVKLGIVSGGVTVVLSLIAGGAWLLGGPALIRSCFDALGVMDKIENLIGSTFLSLENSCRMANIIDAVQKTANVGIGKPATFGNVDDLFGESAIIVAEKSSSAIKSDLEKIIKSDPEILAAYKKGKKLKPKFDAKLKAD